MTMERVKDTNNTPPAATNSREQVLNGLKNLSKEEYNDVLNHIMTEDF